MLPENPPNQPSPNQPPQVPPPPAPPAQPPQQPPPPPMPVNSFFANFFAGNKKIFIPAGIVVVLFLVVGTLLLTRRPAEQSSPQQAGTKAADLIKEYENPDGTYYASAISPALNKPPKVDFKYVSQAQAPTAVQSAEILKLNSNLTEAQAQTVASKFNIQVKPTLIGQGNYHFYDPDKRIDLVVYNKSGAFVATFLDNLLSSPSAEPKVKNDIEAVSAAKEYLKGLNLWEDSLTATMGNPYPVNPVVYKRDSQKDNYFIEFHRGWTSLPILNQVGMLNSLLKEQMEDPRKFLAVDKDISYSSDNLVGFQRPDQFNTVTVGLNPDGKINYLQYYLRTITAKEPVAIKPYEKALDEMLKGQGIGTLVYPLAQRAAEQRVSDFTKEEWQQLFPDNLAQSQEAVIDEVQLAFEEKLITEGQSIMTPMYIFRGKAPLKNGTIINFTALIDARSN